MELKEALDRYLVQLDADGRARTTREQRAGHIRMLDRWIHREGVSLGVADLGHEDLARFLASPIARLRADGTPKKAASVNVLRTSLRCFFTYVHDAGFTGDNPARLRFEGWTSI